MGILLFIISGILLYILSLPLMIYTLFRAGSLKAINEYFYQMAISADQFGNTIGAYLFNDLFIAYGGYKFGNPDDTISSVMGRNYVEETLTKPGKGFRVLIDKMFGKNHCINAIMFKINNQ